MVVCDGLGVGLEEQTNPLGSEKAISGGENPLWDIAQPQGRPEDQARNVCQATFYILGANSATFGEYYVAHSSGRSHLSQEGKRSFSVVPHGGAWPCIPKARRRNEVVTCLLAQQGQ